ncbi:acetyltransferase [Methylomicrobium lacus]|uniref:acetyltransferase n=1 Tax=Methylomicrobium lacus TaxID=136992 RepID=UPI0035A8A51B
MSDPIKRYILWGSSGHAKVLAELITLLGGNVVALFDNNPEAESVLPNVPLFVGLKGFLRWRELNRGETVAGLAAIGGGRGKDRLDIHKLFKQHDVTLGTLVHPDATVSRSSILGAGSQIMAQSVVAADTRLGEGCIINHGANVDHECLLGDGIHLAPAATLCGCITLGNNVFIGAGAVVLPKLTIGHDTIVAAGAVVTRSLPAGVVAVGNPARIIRAV